MDAAPLYLGLISGTSADAIDVALASFEPQPRLVAALAAPYPAALRPRVLALAREKADISLDELGSLDTELGHAFADAALALLAREGIAPQRISFGNTIKKESDIARAHKHGVGLFAFDSHAEVEKLARAAPGARVFCRIFMTGEGADWPLSRKFGCDIDMARDLLVRAREMPPVMLVRSISLNLARSSSFASRSGTSPRSKSAVK